jgi:predicted phosphodiesterase
VVVHLSDLHFTVGDPGLEERNALIRDRLVADLNGLIGQTGTADAVVVTGDIAYSGKAAEYEQADQWFKQIIDPITAGPTRLLCVPGNHDVDWSRIGPTHEGHRSLIRQAGDDELDALLDRYLAEDGQAILFPLAAYNEFAASLNCQVVDRFSWDARLLVGSGYELDFRGITTVVNSHDSDEPGKLAVHANQLLLSPAPGRVPILMAHHDPHFWRRSHRLGSDVTNRMSLALYGHTHAPRCRVVDQCIEVTGGAVQPEEGKDWMPAYNVLQLSVEPVDDEHGRLHLRAWRRRYSHERDRFISDTATGTFDEHNVLVSTPPSDAPSSETSLSAVDGGGEEERVDLTTSEGQPQPLREIQRALFSLGAGDRIALLVDIGLPTDELARLPPHKLIAEAAQAVITMGLVSAFRSALAKRQRRQDGG